MAPGLPIELVGSRLRSFSSRVEPRHLVTYAAVVAPHHQLHFDDEQDVNPPAPPLFAVAVTWRLVERLGELLTVPIPEELLARMVHFSEQLELARLIRAGEQLRLDGEIVAMLPHAMGARLVIQIICKDLTDSNVYTEQIEALFLGVEGPEAPITAPSYQPARVGSELRSYTSSDHELATLQIPRELPFLYDAASNISAPIHISPRFAKSVGLPCIILHGTCSAALAVTALVDRFAGGDPRRVRAFSCKFRGLVLPPAELTIELTHLTKIDRQTELRFHLNNADGSSALRDATLLIDGDAIGSAK